MKLFTSQAPLMMTFNNFDKNNALKTLCSLHSFGVNNSYKKLPNTILLCTEIPRGAPSSSSGDVPQ